MTRWDVARDYTGVVALKKPCNLGTSILMTEPGGLQAWRLAASMKWICVDFMESRGPGSGGIWRPVAACGTGLDGSRGPKETLQSWNPHEEWMTR